MASTKTSAYSPLETVNTETEAHAVELIGLPLVQVKAPSDLPGGYHLCVEINGKKTLVAIVRTHRYLTVHGNVSRLEIHSNASFSVCLTNTLSSILYFTCSPTVV
jgi:hypothetical protein